MMKQDCSTAYFFVPNVSATNYKTWARRVVDVLNRVSKTYEVTK